MTLPFSVLGRASIRNAKRILSFDLLDGLLGSNSTGSVTEFRDSLSPLGFSTTFSSSILKDVVPGARKAYVYNLPRHQLRHDTK